MRLKVRFSVAAGRLLVEIDNQLSALQKIFESVVMFLINNRNFALGFCYPETYY